MPFVFRRLWKPEPRGPEFLGGSVPRTLHPGGGGPEQHRNTTCMYTCQTQKLVEHACSEKHACIHTHKDKQTDRQTDILTHAYVHAYMFTDQHIYIHTCMHTYIHTYIHASINTHTCMHTYIHTYIHTYLHRYIDT